MFVFLSIYVKALSTSCLFPQCVSFILFQIFLRFFYSDIFLSFNSFVSNADVLRFNNVFIHLPLDWEWGQNGAALGQWVAGRPDSVVVFSFIRHPRAYFLGIVYSWHFAWSNFNLSIVGCDANFKCRYIYSPSCIPSFAAQQ